MVNLRHLVTISLMVAALAAPGFAKSGGDNGGNKGKQKNERAEGKQGKKKANKHDSVTSVSLGEIVVDDDRILDLTGDYDLTSGTASVDLSIVQDDRGRLVASADLVLPDGLSTTVELLGRLKVSGRDGDLSFRLEGCVGETSKTEEDDHDYDYSAKHEYGDDHNGDYDDDECTTGVRITGEWEGSAFGTEVCITTATGTVCYDLRDLVPVNTLRGLTIGEPMDEDRKGKGHVVFSERLVMLPWGTETVRSIQVNTPKGFHLILNGSGINAQIRGSFDSSGETDIDSARINLGYGKLDVDPEDIELPAVQ